MIMHEISRHDVSKTSTYECSFQKSVFMYVGCVYSEMYI